MRKYSKTSKVWDIFEKVEGGAICSLCKNTVGCMSNTSNLIKHLRRKHKGVLSSQVVKRQSQRNHEDTSDFEESEGEGVAPSEEEASEAVTEANAAVHTIEAYRDAHGTTFLYLQPAPEGEQGVQIQNTQFQPVVASSESITANGEVISVPVQKDPSAHEGQPVEGEAKTQEDSTPRRLIHAPVKNYQGSSIASRAVIRQVARPNPIKTSAPVTNSNNCNNNNSNKEDTFEAFGKYIASMLRNLPSKNAWKLQGEIVNWILKEQIKSAPC